MRKIKKTNWYDSHFKAYVEVYKNYFCKLLVDKYYQLNKEKLQKEARERYQNLSEEEKEKRPKKIRDW